MTLPSSRNRTYAADSPIRSVDLNDIQDSIIGGKHGAIEMVFTPLPAGDVVGTYTYNLGYLGSGGSLFLQRPLDGIRVGDVITSWTARAFGSGAGTISCDLYRWNGSGGSANLGNIQAVSPAAAWTTYSAAPFSPYTVLATDCFYASIASDNAGHRLATMNLGLYRP